jgi:hypothetical protein
VIRHQSLFVVAGLYAAATWLGCGGSSPSTPTPLTQTDELSGTIRWSTGAAGGYNFTSADGLITVTLVQVTPPTSLSMSMCPESFLHGGPLTWTDCTFVDASIKIGQTLQARRRGGAQQAVWFIPSTSAGVDYSYRGTVTYPK